VRRQAWREKVWILKGSNPNPPSLGGPNIAISGIPVILQSKGLSTNERAGDRTGSSVIFNGVPVNSAWYNNVLSAYDDTAKALPKVDKCRRRTSRIRFVATSSLEGQCSLARVVDNEKRIPDPVATWTTRKGNVVCGGGIGARLGRGRSSNLEKF
jgi:hypothetical protein